jgi:hypothetical protein
MTHNNFYNWQNEHSFCEDPKQSFYYAKNHLFGRFRMGEKAIASDLDYAYKYARYVIKDTFPLCHDRIFNSEYKDLYIEFLKSINYDLSKISEWLI